MHTAENVCCAASGKWPVHQWQLQHNPYSGLNQVKHD